MMGHSVEYALKRANKALKKGAIVEAKKIYESVLQVFPGNKRAQNGVALTNKAKAMTNNAMTEKVKSAASNPPNIENLKKYYEDDNLELTISEADKLLKQYPENASIWNFKGAAHGKAAQYDDALKCFTKVIEFSDTKASANNNIGSVWREKGDYQIAEAYFREALRENPHFFDAQKNLGALLHQTGNHEMAIKEFEKALLIKPENVEILSALGSVFNSMQKTDDATVVYNQILKIDPQNKRILNNLGNIHLGNKSFEDAVLCYEKALQIDPNYSDAMNNLGNALKEMEYLDEALYYYAKAISIPNSRVELYSNYGVALKDSGRFDEALEMLDKALEKKPNYPDAEWNKALVYLSQGNFEKGWDAYEWRWSATNFDSTPLKTLKPIWQGRKERVLVWPEQGLGDQIMFSTLFEEFAEKCSLAIFQVDPRLLALFRRTYPAYHFIPSDKFLNENEYDSHIPMGSLGKYLRRSKDDFLHAKTKLLQVDHNTASNIKQAFRLGEKQLVGISWRSKNNDTGARRSLELSQLAKSLIGENTDIVSLQYGETKEEIQQLYTETGIQIKTVDQIDTFSDIDRLAALISCCDKIVTIDNSTVHLAAAIGVETHLLLPYVSDWRWHPIGQPSFWYKNLNIYRRDKQNTWLNLIEELSEALNK